MGSRSQIDISLELDLAVPLEPEIKVCFYRIAQEALNNVVKHSEATHATVSLRVQAGSAHMRITDNGRGFDPAQISTASLGLGIMRERAQAVGSRLTIGPSPSRGTQVSLTWPADSE